MPLGYPSDLKAKSLTVSGQTVLSNLTVTSTTSGFVVPRMNTAERTALTNVVDGTLIYNTQLDRFEAYANSTWGYLTLTAV